MPYEDLFNLKGNPFRLTPAVSSDEIFWAGFPGIKQQFETRIKRAMKIPNSSLVLNWGEYGSGKTHAARYFGKRETLASLAEQVGMPVPFFTFITLPKGKNPIDDFYTSIIDKIDIQGLREMFAEDLNELTAYIDGIGDNNYVNAVLKAIFNDEVDLPFLRRYLYQSTTASDNKALADVDIMRAISSDTDYSKIISGLFSCITFKKKYYSTIILWIDEFEDIAIMTKVNGDKTNSFLREIIDNTPNNLLIYLNLTQSSLFNIEDLGEYISEAVKSRIKDRINFEIPKREETLEYIRELLGYYRVDPVADGRINYFPFDEGLLNQLLQDLNNSSLRGINESLGLLLDLGELDNLSPITRDYYDANKSEILGDWKG